MACGVKEKVEESYWTVCWWYIAPYPCKNTRITTKFRYDFMPTRTVSTWPFHCKWQGCCGRALYEWSYWCWGGTGDSAWNRYNSITHYFDSEQYPIGDCPFSPQDIG